ncbi:PhoPQ-activated pathogenicity-related family protein [Burkholderia thailandensis]|uniref:PhoPQ-activated pathogenicity-related family protein n=1 Tax=Burkholderia thailandensis TaxID=57975 RepID=UPI0002F06543|nr:PhoPQ-activated protein PqaA family protein [Burkholderia thailandensis]AVR29121.1 PhoPQ-regulated protein [Burkholderia thailandensis]MDD1483829.1 PhoPQ-regulated protein [Burkholderia thailandensis]MDD1490029.1 PhoPQ-regulated protein [Burkholderia thailandensis]MDD1495956.1 PhoPQ-regulated protein [Burkholderia thailandensis]PJO68671.1 PhoPQ-regulated protein [Burkholderia thailandensis]
MLKKVAGAIALSMLSITYPHAEAAPMDSPCQADAHRDLTDTLACYRQTMESQPLNYTMTSVVQLPGIEQRTYRLVSQSWSPDQLVRPDTWVHEVTLYIPQDALPHRALVIANDGTRHPSDGETPRSPNDFLPDTLTDIARNTRTAVISVSDVPNQLLTYAGDGKPKAEDDSVARSWTLFMQSPHTRATMPLHVPMAASVWRAMSLAERELTTLGIHRFVVSGISKRAWTTWLALIGDKRIDAIAPFAIDLLSTRAALDNMYRSYGGNWPLAFYPYYAEGIDRTLDSRAFGLLMRIEDPLSYLGTRHGSRLAVPKYIVNASGDDFFVPDNSQLYFDKLPGAKALRMVPNASHSDIRRATRDSLIPFVNRIQHGKALPQVEAMPADTNGQTILRLRTSEQPRQLLLWQATNPHARDFRYACGIRYTSTPVTMNGAPPRRLVLDRPASGWRAYFVEATFDDGFVATSQTYILGDGYPSTAPPPIGDSCRTLPGRNTRS